MRGKIYYWETSILDNLYDISALGLTAFCVTFGVAALIVLSHNFIFSNPDRSLSDVQVAHVTPTPRYGGLAVFVAIVVSLFIYQQKNVTWIILSSLPIFMIGLAEDYYFQTSPKLRYIFGACSALFGIFLSGVVLNSIDVIYFDEVLAMPIIAFLFTVFCIVGLINAVNLIDGIHGLSSGVCVLMSLSFSVIAQKVGDVELTNLGIVLAAASLGLMVFNYPLGKIFLGDGGAYLMGFTIAWLMILLAMRHEDISKWSLLAIASWPIIETVFSILRRKLRGRLTYRPDRMHFHHIVMRGLEITSRKRIPRQKSNPLATLIILPLACIPAVLGTFYSQSHQAGVAICLVSICLYISFYNGLLYVLRKRRYQFSKIGHKLGSRMTL